VIYGRVWRGVLNGLAASLLPVLQPIERHFSLIIATFHAPVG
jgi:hypothetical protein